MCSQIIQLETTAKLPSYLFVLTATTEINEKILLHCQNSERNFINSMLNLIGIQSYSPTLEITGSIKSLFILNTIYELSNKTYTGNNYSCNIIYVTNGTFSKAEKQNVERILSMNQNYIIVSDIEPLISEKRFLISIHQNNQYYKKIIEQMLRCRNTY